MFLSKFLANQPQTFNYNFRNFRPCGVCAKHCDPRERLILDCGICEKYFHRACIRLSKQKFKNIKLNNDIFICGSKCFSSVLPFADCDNIDFFTALYGNNEMPKGLP